ncbi:hypothetical protein C2S52_006141 [Perilla frutescens var. hirtella]|nr:hypothetical protein C2S51_009640 [Perilla frutescens var. frutescens]KAH6786589.1 hypothetical protein C2S52_006141 [Perilla frutescens var. hirtella]
MSLFELKDRDRMAELDGNWIIASLGKDGANGGTRIVDGTRSLSKLEQWGASHNLYEFAEDVWGVGINAVESSGENGNF